MSWRNRQIRLRNILGAQALSPSRVEQLRRTLDSDLLCFQVFISVGESGFSEVHCEQMAKKLKRMGLILKKAIFSNFLNTKWVDAL